MSVINTVTKGADLTRPSLSLGWLIPATFAVVALGVVMGVGMWMFNLGKSKVTGQSSISGGIATLGAAFGNGS